MKYRIILLSLSVSLLSCQDDFVNRNPLPGQWQLLGYANEQGQLTDPESDSSTNPLSIRLTDNSVQADLDINNLWARYRLLNDSVLLISDLTYTEAVGTPREQKLLTNFPRDTARYRLQAGTLVLFPTGNNNRAPDTNDTPTVYQRAN